MAIVVPIDSVKPLVAVRFEYGIKRMRAVLERQGQIEPLQINPRTERPHRHDVHGDDIIYAARDLGWDTILIVHTDRYQE